MSNPLPDEVAACNMIHRLRKDTRINTRGKNISIPLGIVDLYIRLNVSVRTTTGCVSMAHSIQYKRICFYPSTNQKLRCTNMHAIERLKRHREYDKEYYARKRGMT